MVFASMGLEVMKLALELLTEVFPVHLGFHGNLV